MKERIQKILGRAGVAARRKVEEMVLEGRISVNDRIVKRLPVLIDPETDRVTVDGETIKLKAGKGGAGKPIYILLNKPSGVYSTNVAQGEQLRAIDLLPPNLPARLYPVGQLDAESKGLLLLTNDGELTNRMTHPRYGVPKTYRAVVDGFVEDGIERAFEKGCRVKALKRLREKSVLEITLFEGRNYEVRRTLAKMGHKVRELTRTRIGPLTLEGLNSGDSRLLTRFEVKQLMGWNAERRNPADGNPQALLEKRDVRAMSGRRDRKSFSRSAMTRRST
jgi:23S rRNA pseudouridine2605 synthase